MITITRGIIGYLVSMVLGVLLATVFYMFSTARKMFYSYVIVLQSIPRISWMLLAMIWFSFDSSIILFIIIITLFPTVTISILEGYESIDEDLIDMARVYNVKPIQILKSIYLPAISTHIVSISKVTLGIMWKTLIMAELLTVPQGLGARMGYLKNALATDQVIAVTLIIVIINCTCQFMITIVSKRMQRWKNCCESHRT